MFVVINHSNNKTHESGLPPVFPAMGLLTALRSKSDTLSEAKN